MTPRAPAAAQALDILEVLAASVEPVSAAHVARNLGLARSTTYYLLDVLVQRGYVRHYTDRRRYGLGIAAHELGSAFNRQAPLRRMAQPIINRLVDTAGHNGHFAVLHGTDIVYLIEERAPHRPVLISEVGVRLPAHLTASGLSLLALLTTPQVRALFPSKDAFVTRRGLGPRSPTELRHALTDVRRDGYAFEQGWVMPDLASISAAAADENGQPLGSFTLTFPDEDLGRRAELAALVVAAASRLGQRVRR